MTNKHISAFALAAVLIFGASHAYASEVTGTLSSTGVTTSNSGTLSGTVSTPAAASGSGTASGGGGGGILGLIGAANNGSLLSANIASPPQPQVLGASVTPAPAVAVAAGSVQGPKSIGSGDVVAVTDSGTVTVAESNQAAAATVAAQSAGIGQWVWWLLALLLLAGAGYYTYRNYGSVQ